MFYVLFVPYVLNVLFVLYVPYVFYVLYVPYVPIHICVFVVYVSYVLFVPYVFSVFFVPHVPHVIYVTGVVNYHFILCNVAQDLKEHQQFFPHIHEKNTFQPNQTAPFIPIMRELCCFSLDQ